MAKKTKKPAAKAKKAAKAAPKKAGKAAPKAEKAGAAKAAPRKKAKARAKGPNEIAKLPTDKQIAGGTLVGLVDDYFSHVGVVAIKLDKPLSVGDMIRVKGHTTDITQKVESMQIAHQPVQAASAGDAVGIRIADKARKGDAIYKV